MAKKPKSNNFDALGSIFDFLFTEAKKKSAKRRAIKPTGVSATNSVTEAAFAALEKPGAFISDTVVGEFNDALDYEMATVKFADGLGNKVSITSNNMIDFLRDPQGVVSEQIKKNKAIRKTMRAAFLGESMRDFVATGWARKYGDLEVQKAVYGTHVSVEQKASDSYSIAKAMGQFAGGDKGAGPSENAKFLNAAESEFMVGRSMELVRKKMIPDAEWDSLSKEEKASFNEAFLRENSWQKFKDTDTPDRSLRDFLTTKYGAGTGSTMYSQYIKATGGDYRDPNAVGGSILGAKTYFKLETEHIDERIRKLESDPQTEETLNELGVYRKTRYLMDRKTGEIKLRSELERIKNDLKSASTPQEKSRLKKELKDTRSALRYMEGSNLMGKIGQLEGYVNSWQTIYGGISAEKFATSVLGGDFFDEGKNTLNCPSTGNKVGDLEFLVAKTHPGNNKFINKYNEMGNAMYYLTPRSVFRTLFFNGEGFAYLMHKGLSKRSDIMSLLGKGIPKNGLPDIYDTNKLMEFVLSKNSLDILNANSANFTPEEMEFLKKFLDNNKTLKGVIKITSFGSYVKNTIQKKILELTAPFRRKFAEQFLMRFVSKYGKEQAVALLNQWIAKGGINVMFRSLATSIAGVLGFAGGPVTSALVSAITFALTDFAMKAFAQMVIFGKYIVYGIIGIIALLFFVSSGAVSKYNKTTTTYANEIPGEIIKCSVYDEDELEEGDTPPWGDAIIPPPSGESCPFGPGFINCSQGWVDIRSGVSHSGMGATMPVDLTGFSYIYAPQFCDDGDCSITRIAVINCYGKQDAGGIVELSANDGTTTYFFKLLHVKPLAGLGEKLSGGQPVAVVQTAPELKDGRLPGGSRCWYGAHLHFEARQNGSVVDPLKFLNSFSCNVTDTESQCYDW